MGLDSAGTEQGVWVMIREYLIWVWGRVVINYCIYGEMAQMKKGDG